MFTGVRTGSEPTFSVRSVCTVELMDYSGELGKPLRSFCAKMLSVSFEQVNEIGEGSIFDECRLCFRQQT
jgi:hypothetical protein